MNDVEDTVTQSFRELAEARDALAEVEALLTGCCAYAEGPRPDLDRAFSTLRNEIERLVDFWSEDL